MNKPAVPPIAPHAARVCASPRMHMLLQNLHFQGQRNDCGPFTIATVLGSLNRAKLDPIQLADDMARPVWRGLMPVIRRLPGSATFPWGMVDIFRSYGLDARWRFRATPDDLRDGLEAGIVLMPIIGSWNPVWAHVMTLVIWDPARGWGFANTQYEHHDIHWLPDEEFIAAWRNTANLVVEVRGG